jgi:hypothetical protein
MERSRRALQQVSTILTHKAIIAWMIEDDVIYGARGLPARTIRAFPEHFRAHQKANLVRAARWWALHDTYFNTPNDAMPTPISSTRSRLGHHKQGLTKAATRRAKNGLNGWFGSTLGFWRPSTRTEKRG